MWRRDCANPAPYREYPSAYPIDDGVGDEISESLTYLCVLNLHGGGGGEAANCTKNLESSP